MRLCAVAQTIFVLLDDTGDVKAGWDRWLPPPAAQAHLAGPDCPPYCKRLNVRELAWWADDSPPAVRHWQQRFAEQGLGDLLRDKTRPPRTQRHSTRMVAGALALTCSKLPDEVTNWTARAMPKCVRISLLAV